MVRIHLPPPEKALAFASAFSVLFAPYASSIALQWYSASPSAIAYGSVWANRIPLRHGRNITFAQAKISRRTKWGISRKAPSLTKYDIPKTGCIITVRNSQKKALALASAFFSSIRLQRVLLRCWDIRLRRVLLPTAVVWANWIPLRHRRNITFAQAKISRRTKWSMSLKNINSKKDEEIPRLFYVLTVLFHSAFCRCQWIRLDCLLSVAQRCGTTIILLFRAYRNTTL